MIYLIDGFQDFFQVLIRIIQRVLVFVLLLTLYLFGFGLTKFFLLIFKSDFLYDQQLQKRESYWQKINEEIDKKNLLSQV